MRPLLIAYYVSGHGLGHLARTSAIVRALLAQSDSVRVEICTHAPAERFVARWRPRVRVRVPTGPLDAGVVEHDPLRIDRDATRERVLAVLARAAETTAHEAAALAASGADLVVADAPFLAPTVAQRAGVPCVLVANFTWDWIYAPYAQRDGRWGTSLATVRAGYGAVEQWLRLPFGHARTIDCAVRDVPLVAGRAEHARAEVLEALGIAPDDARLRVLLAGRSGIDARALARACHESPETLFLHRIPGADPSLPNARALRDDERLGFHDVLAASDAVVAKLGYGTVADCVAAGIPLLFARRDDFREDRLLAAGVRPLGRAHEIATDDLREGRWLSGLTALREQPAPAQRPRADGAAVCAKWLLARARGTTAGGRRRTFGHRPARP